MFHTFRRFFSSGFEKSFNYLQQFFYEPGRIFQYIWPVIH